MKYSFMTFSCPSLSLDEVLSVAREYGYDGIEPRIEAGHKHGVELTADGKQRKEIRKKAVRSGIEICCVATSCRYADPAKAEESVEIALKSIDLAANIGCSRIRVFGGGIPSGLSRAKATEQVRESLLHLGDHAAERKVTVCVETHDDWCRPEDLAEVLHQVDHPAIAVNWDIMHPIMIGGATMDEAFEVLKSWIRHVHFHDGIKTAASMELSPVGEGIIDHKKAVRLLGGIGYQGFLSGEWINWRPYEDYLAAELATMKGYEQNCRG
ncbi:MAG: sugar phosphate isomerase/epimerase family protein [Planctomycetota bacterium]